jgi:hypothetical protein
MKFYEAFFRLPIPERKRIADDSGMSLKYILKHIYVNERDPKFHMHNAVALDKASGGALPFYKYTEGGVDWSYVLDRLKHAKRLGELNPPKVEEPQL